MRRACGKEVRRGEPGRLAEPGLSGEGACPRFTALGRGADVPEDARPPTPIAIATTLAFMIRLGEIRLAIRRLFALRVGRVTPPSFLLRRRRSVVGARGELLFLPTRRPQRFRADDAIPILCASLCSPTCGKCSANERRFARARPHLVF